MGLGVLAPDLGALQQLRKAPGVNIPALGAAALDRQQAREPGRQALALRDLAASGRPGAGRGEPSGAAPVEGLRPGGDSCPGLDGPRTVFCRNSSIASAIRAFPNVVGWQMS